MIEGGSYESIYLLIVTIYTLYLSNQYSQYPNSRLNETVPVSKVPAMILTMFMILFIGFRPQNWVFVDMKNYVTYYNAFAFGESFHFDKDAENLIFDNLFYYLGSEYYNITVFFVIIAIIYFGGIYLSSRKLFPKDTLYAIVIYLAGFSTFSYGTNGIKAGAAAAIFLCAFGYYRKKIICGLLLLASLGFHHSMVLPIAAFAVCYFYRKPKTYLWVWVVALLIAAAHITFFQDMFGGMADESGSRYLMTKEEGDEGGYYSGFRPDFILYSFAPVAVGYYVIFKKNYQSKLYNLIFCTYVLANAVWMLCIYASFTNRIAYLSWFMLPYVLVYPFFDKEFMPEQYKAMNKVAWGQLAFTLLMTIIYYGK